MEFINDLMQYGFLQKALFTSIMVGVISGVIGSFIILRGMALMGDAISHAVLPGVAISFMLGINYFYGAVLMGVLRSEEHTSELQSRGHLVCRLLLEKKKKNKYSEYNTI